MKTKTKKKGKCPMETMESCPIFDILLRAEEELQTKEFPYLVEEFTKHIVEKLRNNFNYLKSNKSKIEFWRKVLEERKEKDILEVALDALYEIFYPVGINIIQEIKARDEFKHISEKCKKLQVKYF